jgi:hypothetical protein
MAEVLMDSIDTRPFIDRAMKVLMEAAAGKANQTDAQELIEELAALPRRSDGGTRTDRTTGERP